MITFLIEFMIMLVLGLFLVSEKNIVSMAIFLLARLTLKFRIFARY